MNKYFFLFVDMIEVLDNQINCLYYLIYYARNLKPDASSLLLLFRFPICISFKPKGEILKSKPTWKAQKSAIQDQLTYGTAARTWYRTSETQKFYFALWAGGAVSSTERDWQNRTDAEKFSYYVSKGKGKKKSWSYFAVGISGAKIRVQMTTKYKMAFEAAVREPQPHFLWEEDPTAATIHSFSSNKICLPIDLLQSDSHLLMENISHQWRSVQILGRNWPNKFTSQAVG